MDNLHINKINWTDQLVDDVVYMLTKGRPRTANPTPKYLEKLKDLSKSFYIDDGKVWYNINSQKYGLKNHKSQLIKVKYHARVLEKIYKDIDITENSTEKLYYRVLYEFIGISRAFVGRWLKNQNNYQIHFNQPRQSIVKPITVRSVNTLLIDLIDLQKIGPSNFDQNYILTAMDSYSKYAYVRTTKYKDKESIIAKLIEIIEQYKADIGYYPKIIRSDNGGEFVNELMTKLLKEIGAKHMTGRSHTPTDQSPIERFNKTLKTKIFAYLSSQELNKNREQHRYYQVLENIVYNYNTSYHTFIKDTPTNIHRADLPEEMKQKMNKIIDKKLNTWKEKANKLENIEVGSKVRMMLTAVDHHVRADKWRKGFLPRWSTKLYDVVDVKYPDAMNTMYLIAYKGVSLGWYYRRDCQAV
jgi:hypothetical protein